VVGEAHVSARASVALGGVAPRSRHAMQFASGVAQAAAEAHEALVQTEFQTREEEFEKEIQEVRARIAAVSAEINAELEEHRSRIQELEAKLAAQQVRESVKADEEAAEKARNANRFLAAAEAASGDATLAEACRLVDAVAAQGAAAALTIIMAAGRSCDAEAFPAVEAAK